MATRHGRSNSFARLRCESLEPRETPSAITVLDYSSGFAGGEALYGRPSGSAANDLLLTDGPFQTRAVWASNRVNVGAFETSFVFRQEGEPGRLGDGFTFAMTGADFNLWQSGTAGAGLGYQGITNSVAVKFDLVDNAGEGGQSVGVFTGGTEPTVPAASLDGSPINLHAQHPIRADLAYDGSILTVTLTDTTLPDHTWTHQFPVDIPAAVGGPTAYVGFTGGTGELFARQAIDSWTFAEEVPSEPDGQPPVIMTPANAARLGADSVLLVVSAADHGSTGGLTYTWETVTAPPGSVPQFVPLSSVRGGVYAHDVTQFGTYTFRVTVRDTEGLTATSEVTYNDVPSVSSFEIVPQVATIPIGGTVQFQAIGHDVFGRQLPDPINPGWRVFQGPGTIDNTGLYTAPPDLSGWITIHAGGGPPEAPLVPWDEARVHIQSAIPPGSGLDFSGGFAGADLARNGSAQVVGDRLRLADGPFQAGSAYTSTPVDVREFSAQFEFRVGDTADGRLGDGLAVVFQNASPTALGGAGEGLGYAGIDKSVALKFDLVDNAGEGVESVGLYLNGATPTVPAQPLTGDVVHLHSGHKFKVDLVYARGTLSYMVWDTVTGSGSGGTFAADIPAAVGGPTAFVGFTAGTGELFAPIDVLDWKYVPTDNWNPGPLP